MLANAMPGGNFEGDEGPKSLDVRMCEMHFFRRYLDPTIGIAYLAVEARRRWRRRRELT